jgi:DNA ligase 4
MGIGKDSEDALAVTKWKLPGQVLNYSIPFLRCHRPKPPVILVVDALVESCLNPLTLSIEILSKRPFREDFGEMTIDEVNSLLDRLSAVSKEYHLPHSWADAVYRKDQQPILTQFYRSMNPTELKWLVRIILRRISSL